MRTLIVILICLPAWVSAQVSYKDSLTAVIKEQAKPVWVKAFSEINTLRSEVKLANENSISKEGVIKHYNTTVGKTIGKQTTLNGVDLKLKKSGDAYVEYVYDKECARVAMEMAAESSYRVKQLKEEK